MLTHLLFSHVPGVRVDRLWHDGDVVHVDAVTTRRAAHCPRCGRRSKRVHSHYSRTVTDLPCCGAPVVIHLHTRRFVCRVRWCKRKIFTERIPTLVAPSARRTVRLRTHLERTGFALGGAPGARHATAQGIAVSRRTLLRLVRAAPLPERGPVRALGVDDWAQRKGQRYGTILVNLEAHRVVDLLPDRTAATFAAWLHDGPEPAIISRDRGGEYADGARQGAPHALQVADRFHLVKNVTDAFERFLMRKHALLRQAARDTRACEETPPSHLPNGGAGELAAAPSLNRRQHEQQECHARRYARYEEVCALRAQGHSIGAIARRMDIAPRTVQRFLHAETFPERAPRRGGPTLLTPFEPFLRERWNAGCHNATQLWRELRERGFTGRYGIVALHLHQWRATDRPSASRCVRRGTAYSPRQTVWLLLRPNEQLTTEESAYLLHLHRSCPEVMVAQALVEEFVAVLKEHDVAGLYAWLHRAEECGIAELRAVARGMWRDRDAVEAAVATEWSNGQTEGQVNRLKVLKRAMYGRAKFDLLRQRMLYAG
ncbi:MAG: ISL3 family transposase [Ktedonobacterales bacterium]|nr:ISL3 family transposase [Ktedonobacterales bacterium]